MRRFALLATALVASAGLVVGLDRPRPDAARAAAPAQAPPCDEYSEATATVDRSRDAVLGPLVLLGAARLAKRRRDGFDGLGYKLPATLPVGVTATISVPRSLRGRVGFVYRLPTQDRVAEEGVVAADRAVRFVACSTAVASGRTGWPGGIVTDRRRCARLSVEVAGGPTIRRRVPLGRAC